MMPSWLAVTLRCWIVFIAFTNFGAAFRCFSDERFLCSKFFGDDPESVSVNGPGNTKEATVLEHLYGFWSFFIGVVLMNCFLFVEEKRILMLSIFALGLYLSFFAIECVIYKSILIHGPTIYPCVLSGLTLLWLLVGYRFLCSPVKEIDENAILQKKFPFKELSRKNR